MRSDPFVLSREAVWRLSRGAENVTSADRHDSAHALGNEPWDSSRASFASGVTDFGHGLRDFWQRYPRCRTEMSMAFAYSGTLGPRQEDAR